MKTTTKKTKNETIVFKNYRFLMEIVLQNGRFQNDRFKKRSFSITIVFKKLVVSLTIVNEERREETDLKSIGTYL